jgi:hypothetical protein
VGARIVAFECLTGQSPFQGVSVGDLAVQICTEKPAVPSSIAPVPPGFDRWFAKATHKDPNSRFMSALEMATTLAEVLQAAMAETAGGKRSGVRARLEAARRSWVSGPVGGFALAAAACTVVALSMFWPRTTPLEAVPLEAAPLAAVETAAPRLSPGRAPLAAIARPEVAPRPEVEERTAPAEQPSTPAPENTETAAVTAPALEPAPAPPTAPAEPPTPAATAIAGDSPVAVDLAATDLAANVEPAAELSIEPPAVVTASSAPDGSPSTGRSESAQKTENSLIGRDRRSMEARTTSGRGRSRSVGRNRSTAPESKTVKANAEDLFAERQ